MHLALMKDSISKRTNSSKIIDMFYEIKLNATHPDMAVPKEA